MSILQRLALILLVAASPVRAADNGTARVVEGFADLADLTLASPVVAQATIDKMEKVSAKNAPGLRPNHSRFLMQADLVALLSSKADVPAKVRYLWDVPIGAKQKPPKLKKAPVLLFLAPGGRTGEYRLVNTQGQIAATPRALASVRSILAEARTPAWQGMRITGVGNAFHVAGTLPGEAESQIFLTTADNRPVSISVLSRPGQRRSYAVATGDVIDAAAKPAAKDTLLWYELACRLPRALPADAAASIEPAARDAVEDDYRFVLAEIGPCGRTLG